MKRFLTLAVLVLLAAPVWAQEKMDEATLRQHMIAAEGRPPDQYVVETHTTSSNGEFV